MNCKCIDGLREKLEKHYRERITTDNLGVELSFLGLDFNTGKSVVLLPVTVTYDHKAKTGRISEKKLNTTMRANFCPFCGEKI